MQLTWLWLKYKYYYDVIIDCDALGLTDAMSIKLMAFNRFYCLPLYPVTESTFTPLTPTKYVTLKTAMGSIQVFLFFLLFLSMELMIGFNGWLKGLNVLCHILLGRVGVRVGGGGDVFMLVVWVVVKNRSPKRSKRTDCWLDSIKIDSNWLLNWFNLT